MAAVAQITCESHHFALKTKRAKDLITVLLKHVIAKLRRKRFRNGCRATDVLVTNAVTALAAFVVPEGTFLAFRFGVFVRHLVERRQILFLLRLTRVHQGPMNVRVTTGTIVNLDSSF